MTIENAALATLKARLSSSKRELAWANERIERIRAELSQEEANVAKHECAIAEIDTAIARLEQDDGVHVDELNVKISAELDLDKLHSDVSAFENWLTDAKAARAA